ncbi:MAG: hypothetical protein GAK28_04711 [Luteibacter sp.]|uniref:hypothetical protein n=1 Tax=Luteibacter sp. TaxID=1886636 RepID=UPI00137DEBE5|nr:hypothetical protein [Luteibacter sp.]KAF1003426.1 MAG: hypothetical protein GAK28_04711 [Luteibacter sp.]
MGTAPTTTEATLESIQGNLIRGRSGESHRLYRLRIDGRWYFCKAGDFADAKQASATLRHATPPIRVTMAPVVTRGRHGLYWLRVHDSDLALSPTNPYRTSGIFVLLILATAVLGALCRHGLAWMDGLAGVGFLLALPVALVVAVATLIGGVFSIVGVFIIASMLRPGRLAAYRTYRRTTKA